MTTITKLDPSNLLIQEYSSNDTNLINNFDLDFSLSPSSYIELSIFNSNNEILLTNYNYNLYKVINDGQSSLTNNISQIQINPENDLALYSYEQGEFITFYNFLEKKIGAPFETLYIEEISSDRTEVRINTTSLELETFLSQSQKFIDERENSTYFTDFYLNLGSNILLICNNIIIDNDSIIVKLYEPLPISVNIKRELWIVTSINEPEVYLVNFPFTPIEIQDFTFLNGPNFNIPIKDQINNSSPLQSYTDITLSSISSSTNQLNSLLTSQSIEINVDYSDFNDFIHFSSIETRLRNFKSKVELIENYSSSINLVQSTTSSLSTINILQNNISEIINTFDNYEYFLYYDSGSTSSWPKTTTTLPYELAKSNSVQLQTWFGNIDENSPYYGGIILSASFYDNENKDQLLKSIPEYLREDPNNKPYELFIDMIAQHYDNIWLYTKDITQKYNNDNRLDFGISKDVVAEAIKDFGIKIYQNNFSTNDLYTAFLGITPSGSLFPFPNITPTLPALTGEEYIDSFISASNDIIPLDDVNKSLYKRIYHNIPYLLNSKGTIAGLRALITTYGIPDTILKINEFGGKDKVNENDWDLYFNKFNYSYYTQGNNNIITNWGINPQATISYPYPGTVAFRFKAGDIPTTSSQQVLWMTSDSSGTTISKTLILEYTGSGMTSGSYSGSIVDPYNEYGTLKYIIDPDTVNETSCSIYLPFFNDGWWSVMVRQDGFDTDIEYLITEDGDFILTENGDYVINNNHITPPTLGTASLYVGNNIYNGLDGTGIGFIASSSLNDPTISGSWFTGDVSYFTNGFIYNSNLIPSFVGELQEIRYYNIPLGNSRFYDFVMNPLSIEGNSINSSPEHLVFRASLGSELDLITTQTGSSIHPKISYTTPVNSFTNNSEYYFGKVPTFNKNYETYFLDQFPTGLKNRISDKIRIVNNNIPSGSTLSSITNINQTKNQPYTKNSNHLEVTFSPQNEINDDITSQLGYFNIGDYIGDPLNRFDKLNSYTSFDKLRDGYFLKYTQPYNVNDFIRLIKYFDNSLFKLIKDFVPARTSLASGVTIKQHLLERNKYPQPSFTPISQLQVSSSVEDIVIPNGGTGGVLEDFNSLNTSPYGLSSMGLSNKYKLTQSWEETLPTLYGDTVKVYTNQDEFYDGVFKGSNITVTTQSLAQPFPQNITAYEYKRVHYFGITKNDEIEFENVFLKKQTTPKPGEILLYHKSRIALGSDPTTWGSLVSVIYDTKYLKISKTDCDLNNISVQLGQVNKLKVQQQNDSYLEYELNPLSEELTYYLFEITSPTQFTYLAPGQIFDYYVSASFTTPQTGPIFGFSWDTVTGNDAHYGTPYFDTSSGLYTLENTPNTLLQVTASIESSGSNGALVYIAKYVFDLNQNQFIGSPISNTVNIPAGPSGIANMSGSLEYILENEYVGLVYLSADTVLNGNLEINQSRNNPILDAATFPITSSCKNVILSPNITLYNYFNSNFYPLQNNVSLNSLNSFINKVDYSSDSITPVNLTTLQDNTATKAQIPDSNYTQLQSINPRYIGTKNQSEKINEWTDNEGINIGNYGKTPSIESKYNSLTYCINGGGLPPEYMDAIQPKIQYLIKDNDEVITANTNEISIRDVQNIFRTGEYVKLNYTSNTAQNTENLYRIIRGGYRVVPIMYNQIGHSPSAFTQSIEFKNILGGTEIVNDYMVKKKPIVNITYPLDQSITGNDTFSDLNFFEVLSSGSDVTSAITTNSLNYYEISSDIINDLNIESLTFSTSVQLSYNTGPQANWQVAIARIRGGVITIQAFSTTQSVGSGVKTFTTTITIPKSDLQLNDRFQVGRYRANGSNSSSVKLLTNTSTFTISQTPLPTPPISTNPLFFTQLSTPNTLIILNQDFISIYGNSNIKQRDIPNSGFFPIQDNLEFKAGDEIRFEGDETKTYMIQSVISSTFTLITTFPALYITLNKPIHNVGIDVNEFLIRRFVEDGSSVILALDGKSTQGGPFYMIPQFITDELDNKLDKLTINLVSKGLI
jgi:hypothetical protein